jgi:hypothetical protein
VIRERDGKVLPAAFRSEGYALTFIRNRVARETEIMVDESNAWNDLAARYVVKTINHQVAYDMDGACTNRAESFFSHMRRAELGHHHHISGVYLGRYARRAHGEKVGAGCTMAHRCRAWWLWRWPQSPRWTSAATGSGPSRSIRVEPHLYVFTDPCETTSF